MQYLEQIWTDLSGEWNVTALLHLHKVCLMALLVLVLMSVWERYSALRFVKRLLEVIKKARQKNS